MKTTRKRYSADFKAKVRWRRIRGDLTPAELGAKHGIHHTMIAAWKRQAIEGMAGTSSGTGEAARAASDAEVDKLHAKIGQLLVERDFFSEGLRSMSVARRRERIDPAHHRLSIAAQGHPQGAGLATMDAGFCVAALEEAQVRYGWPEIFSTDQGGQFTSSAFTSVLRDAEVRISMDGRGRWMDNVFIERLWRSLKYECVYLHAFETGSELKAGVARWIAYCNTQRPHSGPAGQTPIEAYRRIGQSDHGGHAPHDLITRQAA